MSTRCPYPGCEWKEESRPYARQGTPSVTSIIAMANLGEKDRKFAWAAAEIAAVTAVHKGEDWTNLGAVGCSGSHKVEPGLCAACRFIRSEFDRQWRAKAALGSHCHHLAASWAAGEEVRCEPAIDPYLDGLELWYKTYNPTWLYLERTISYRTKAHEYVGTFDATAVIDCPLCPADENGPARCTWLLDIKTGEGKWWTEWALQLSAYAYSKYLTTWKDGKEHKESSMPRVAHAGVIWVQPGEALLLPVEISAETHNTFLRLLDVAGWERRFEKSLVKQTVPEVVHTAVP